MLAISDQSLARKTLEIIKILRNNNSLNLYHEDILKRADSYKMVENPNIRRKREKPTILSWRLLIGTSL